jgi:hypothetical protein
MKVTRFKYAGLEYSRTTANVNGEEKNIISYVIQDKAFYDLGVFSALDYDSALWFTRTSYVGQTVQINPDNVVFYDIRENKIQEHGLMVLCYLAWLVVEKKDSQKRCAYHKLERFLGNCTDAFIGGLVEGLPNTEKILILDWLWLYRYKTEYYFAEEGAEDTSTKHITLKTLCANLKSLLVDPDVDEESVAQIRKIVYSLG